MKGTWVRVREPTVPRAVRRSPCLQFDCDLGIVGDSRRPEKVLGQTDLKRSAASESEQPARLLGHPRFQVGQGQQSTEGRGALGFSTVSCSTRGTTLVHSSLLETLPRGSDSRKWRACPVVRYGFRFRGRCSPASRILVVPNQQPCAPCHRRRWPIAIVGRFNRLLNDRIMSRHPKDRSKSHACPASTCPCAAAQKTREVSELPAQEQRLVQCLPTARPAPLVGAASRSASGRAPASPHPRA